MRYDLEKRAGSFRKTASSDKLQVLAKRATRSFVEKESNSLNQAIATVIKDEDLNSDQVRRVSEMANQQTWKTMFVEGGERQTNFDPADSDNILKSLDASPSVYHRVNEDYLTDPGEQKPNFDALEKAFKSESSELKEVNPVGEEVQTYEKAASVENLARYSIDSLMMALNEVSEQFYGHVKHAHLTDEFGILQISKAVGDVVGSEKFASSIMSSAAQRLKSEGVKISTQDELLKAKEHVVVNTEHPVLVSATKLEKLAMAYKKAKIHHKKAKNDKKKAREAIKDKLKGQ